ncbi:hypothetical protein QTP81_15740 [Alteromonas sp. ASW11-36]|uniref:Flagellar biosynthesis protein FlgE n=1 Tax=Alteromonas arenosi TaxID=3055817 RepID=A0ABT7T0T8_9ALTE|nr:hypothetical protein [Alteromonas sp. ASW11-36]MDM7862056.1 hypothetical protein [Alteromonas sp. ASW11-36]
MPIDTGYNVNSAILSGQFGLQRASEGITQASLNLAQRVAQQDVAENGPAGVLLNAAEQQIGNTRNLLPSGGDSVTTDLLSLQINARNAQASAAVVDRADETVGRIIDIFA